MLAWRSSLGESPVQGIVSPSYCVYKPTLSSIYSRYYHYLFRTDIYANVFKQYSTGIIDSRLRLYSDKFFSLFVQLPPLAEQQRITDYLDAKCAYIDQCLELTRQSMEKLRAYKLSCITEAVTKGLDPDVPLKNSGVPWIGQIPAGWSLTLIGRHVDILPGFAFPSSLFNQDKGIKLLRGINLGVNCVKWDECIYYDENITENLKIFFLKKNDIIIDSRRRGSYGK